MKTTLKNLILLIAIQFTVFSFSQSQATYDIAVTTIWNSTNHTWVPDNAHWSDLIGATHATANEFVELGQVASQGIKNVAESGANSAFISEINAAITANTADQLLQDGFAPIAGNNSNAGFTDVTISSDFPLVTLVSMVAPSPDWFIAINSVNLRSGDNLVNNGWKDTFTMDVFAYDAGTDSGTDYNSENQETNPFQSVSMASGAPINGNKMASVTFTLKSTLSAGEVDAIKNVSVYPNPATTKLNISNRSNILVSAEIYNILGKRVYATNINNSINYTINTTNLQSGLYILRLNANDGSSSSRKVIIE